MKYGIKLDPRNFGDPRWEDAFCQPAWFFWRAREYGLGFVEFTWPEDAAPAEVAHLGRLAWREGLTTAIHPYFYGPLAAGATVVMYEGAPDWPDKDRFWEIVERYGVTILYTAPTAIRAFMKWGDSFVDGRDLSSLRLLGTVGEPINPEAWVWYHETIGGGRCPIVDTWWQTETGQILITPLPGITSTKPGSATLPFPGISAEILSNSGARVPVGGGYLAITGGWPARTLGIWGDEERFIQTYWSKWSRETYFPGDGAKRDEDGYFWILGRVDDVINVSGHRLGTAEIESALVAHPTVAEAAVVGYPHPIKGESIFAFVILKPDTKASDDLSVELTQHVRKLIGPIASPEKLQFTDGLPKTRSGKIMRRILRKIAAELGDYWLPWMESVETYEQNFREIREWAKGFGREGEVEGGIMTFSYVANSREDALKALSGRVKVGISLRKRLLEDLGYEEYAEGIIDLWDNRIRHVDLSQLGQDRDCSVCQQGQYDWLSGRHGSSSAVLCGRHAVQLSGPPNASISLDELAERLEGVGQVVRNPYLLRLTVDDCVLTVFADGRTIVSGTDDLAVARTLHARYVGA